MDQNGGLGGVGQLANSRPRLNGGKTGEVGSLPGDGVVEGLVVIPDRIQTRRLGGVWAGHAVVSS